MSRPKLAKIPRKTMALSQGLASLRNRNWRTAFSQLTVADQASSLNGDELEALAIAAHLSGNETQALELLSRIHQAYLDAGNVRRAARFAFWLGFIALNEGQLAQSNGWLARATRLLEGHKSCLEHGYLLIPAGIHAARSGQIKAAVAAFLRAGQLGKRFGDKDLMTMALNGYGRALIRGGDHAKGVKLLDEAMVAVVSGEVSPIVAGGMYCSVLESCRETHDLRRAQEWTRALDQWCAEQPELVPYRGHCLLHRAELLQLRGSWREALQEALDARDRLSYPTPKPARGAALYHVGELHRLLGEFAEAEEAYLVAAKAGHTGQPGLALLRLAQGRPDAAAKSIRSHADAVGATGVRPSAGQADLLEACIEIALAEHDLATARRYARGLRKLASKYKAPILRAMAACAEGAVLLASGDPRGALPALRRSSAIWSELDAPYPAARARALAARACLELDDCDASRLELASARDTFERLEAVADLKRLDKEFSAADPPDQSSLSSRETEVLRLVASGATNRAIAQSLSISEKTVARHLSNIFVKLDLSSRSAATAYAFRHRLV
jgi:ATP/maltotriose-dependent transcriptional regulator MalT